MKKPVFIVTGGSRGIGASIAVAATMALLFSALASAAEQRAPLRVYGALSVVELGPVLMAAQRVGPEAVVVSNGGVPNLFKPGEAEVATNAETQALRVSVEHPDLRIILTVAEGYYRLVARKSAGVAKLSDLRGKKIGTVPNTSAAYYLHRMLATARLSESDVTVVPIVPLSNMPTALKKGDVDAITIWEPEIQNAQEALGADAIEFQDKAVYRELFNLNTTAANLADPVKRKQIVAFVAEILRACADLRAGSKEAFPLVAKSTGYDPELLAKIWHHEGFYGDLVHDLPDVMADEDVWLAQATQRTPRTRAELVALVDPTVRLEALELLQQSIVPASKSAPTLQDAQRRVEAVAVAVDNVDAIRAVKRLQYAYAQCLEQGRVSDIVSLFADSGSVEIGDKVISGRPALRQHFALPADRLNLRMSLSPVINLSADGTRAKGRWREVAMLGERGTSATWEGGIYENDYVREKGVWKIAAVHFYPQYAGTYEAGWRSVSQTPFLVPYHYDARSAGIPIPDEARTLKSSSSERAQTISALAARLAALDQRVQGLNDAADVQNLQHAYGYYVDRKMWVDVADLFVPGAQKDVGLEGLKEGELNDRLQLEAIVTVAQDGRSARAQGIQLGMTSTGGVGKWSENIYQTDFVQDNGVWKIATARVFPRFTAEYSKGWQDSELGPFPRIEFANPVTQRTRAVRVRSKPPADLATFMTQIAAVERKVARAEAYDGAENVANAYGYYIDEFKWDDTGELFAREGWKELSYIGTYVGRDRVRDSMTLRYGSRGRTGKQMTLHQKTQPVVHASPDGQSARIRTRLFQINSVTDSPGSYIGGIYENEVVKEDGVWKIAGMDLDYTWSATYAKGWAQAKREDALVFAPRPDAPLPPLAPDRPLRGARYAPFPVIVDVPFHYRNPVSGRAPPVLLLP